MASKRAAKKPPKKTPSATPTPLAALTSASTYDDLPPLPAPPRPGDRIKLDKPELIQHKYQIPVLTDKSVELYVSGATCSSAILYVGISKISQIIPNNKDKTTKFRLPFLGEALFHRGLLSDCEVIVELITEDTTFPSLHIVERPLPVAIGEKYKEVVTSEYNGTKKELVILYGPKICGFVIDETA